MYANPPDDPRERLNYSNGQRLAAADFRAEQGHHDGMRRMLNRALYSSGIVTGLDVELAKSNPPDLPDKHSVIVKRGLAFDHLGREIFLPVDMAVKVMGAPSTTPGVVFGNLLVISYREQRKSRVSDGCSVASPAAPCSSALAWGAPTRIAADAAFEVLDSWPADESGKVVIAQLELNPRCEVVRALPGVRKYAVPVKPQKVRGISLEGEKNIDKANAKVLYFHVDGGSPEAVSLYLRGMPFSSLYYTELGKHSHTLTMSDLTINLNHGHTVHAGTVKTQEAEGQHKHSLFIGAGMYPSNPVGLVDTDAHATVAKEKFDDLNPIHWSGAHQHNFDLTSIKIEDFTSKPQTLPVKDAKVGDTGSEPAARVGKPALTTLKGLVVKLDDVEITGRICDQLEANPLQVGRWRLDAGGVIRLNGASLSQADGTGEIDLLKLREIGIGQHKLEFLVTDDFGGNLQYNLYVS
jgi:hypothetical protein